MRPVPCFFDINNVKYFEEWFSCDVDLESTCLFQFGVIHMIRNIDNFRVTFFQVGVFGLVEDNGATSFAYFKSRNLSFNYICNELSAFVKGGKAKYVEAYVRFLFGELNIYRKWAEIKAMTRCWYVLVLALVLP